MGFQLLDQLLLVVFVDECNLFAFNLIIALALYPSERYLIGIGKPNGLVSVFEKLALHFKDFDFVQFGAEKGHFHALLHAVFELIVLYQLHVLTYFAIIVHDFSAWIGYIHRRIKLDEDRFTNS